MLVKRAGPLWAHLYLEGITSGRWLFALTGHATAPVRGRTIGSGRNARFDRAGYEGDAHHASHSFRRAALAHDDLKGPK
jgi:hypothetical protein